MCERLPTSLCQVSSGNFCRGYASRGLRSKARICASRIRNWLILLGAGDSKPGGDTEVQLMRAYVSICAALIAAGLPLSAQTRPENSERPTTVRDAQPATRRERDAAVPASRYS